jgi:hypothetical protein
MKNETIKEPFVNVVKRIRDDIEDKKLNPAIKEMMEKDPVLFLKAELTYIILETPSFLPQSER